MTDDVSHLNLVTSTSGGVNIGDSVTIGGDVVGRDTSTTIFIGDQQYDVHGLANPYLGLQSFTYAGCEKLIVRNGDTSHRPG